MAVGRCHQRANNFAIVCARAIPHCPKTAANDALAVADEIQPCAMGPKQF